MRIPLLLFTLLIFTSISFGQTAKKTEIAELENCRLYYEVYGEGTPLFLLHGFFQSSQYWKQFVEKYSDDYEVYLVDLTGHGNSTNFKEKISIPEAADDLYSLVKYLGLNKVNAIGYSFGGDVIFHLAAKHPDIVQSMITIGGLGTWDVKDHPDWIEYFSNKNIINLQWILEFQPDESRAKWLLDHFVEYQAALGDEELANIKTNTLMVLGDDDDSIPMTEVMRARKQIPSSDLWIVPNSDHNAHEGKNKANFVKFAKQFFGKK